MAITDKLVCFAFVMLLGIGVCFAARTLMNIEGYGAGDKGAVVEDGKKQCGSVGGEGGAVGGVGGDGVAVVPTGNGNSEGIVGAVVGHAVVPTANGNANSVVGAVGPTGNGNAGSVVGAVVGHAVGPTSNGNDEGVVGTVVGNIVGPTGNGNAEGVVGAVGPTGSGNAEGVVGAVVSQAVGTTGNGNGNPKGVVGAVANQAVGSTGNGNTGGVLGAKASKDGVAVRPIVNGQGAVGQTKGFGRPEGFVAGKGVNLGGTPGSSTTSNNGVGDGGLVGNVVGKPLHG